MTAQAAATKTNGGPSTAQAESELFRRVAAYSQRPMKQPDRPLVFLEAGEPNFDTPAHVVEAMAEALRSGYTKYPPGAGDPELLEALAARVAARAKTAWGVDGIYVTHGASGGCGAAIFATVNPGDRVILPDPTYSLHADQVIAAGAAPIFCPLLSDFHLDLDALEVLARDARMIVLTNPTNPTGVVYTRDELLALGEIAEKHDLVVLSDEVYDHLVFDGIEFTSTLEIPTLRHRLIYAWSFGKTCAMTGWRIGYLAASPDRIKACRLVHRTVAASVNTATQRAALAALNTPAQVLEERRLDYQGRRDLVLEGLRGIDGVTYHTPAAAWYVFPRIERGATSAEIVQAALEHGVAIRSGAEYGPGGEGHIRISYSVDADKLVDGLGRLRKAISSL